jgi:hypothetical protein
MTRFLLDTNIFIQAKNLHYGFDFCPAFWEWLISQNATGRVASIDKVGDELQAGVTISPIGRPRAGAPSFFPRMIRSCPLWAA